KLAACFQILAGDLERFTGLPHHFSGKANARTIEDSVDHVGAAAHLFGGRCFERQVCGAAAVGRDQFAALEAGRIGFHEIKRTRTNNYDEIGDVAVGNILLGAGELAALIFELRLARRVMRALIDRDRCDDLTRCDLRPPFLLLCIRAGQQHRACARKRRTIKRRGNKRAPALLKHRAQRDVSQARAAIHFRNDHASEAKPRDLAPQIRIAAILLRIALLTQARHRRLFAEKITRRVLQHARIVIQSERHCVSRSPSTRLATTLRLISVVPPWIELPFDRNQPRVVARSSAEKPSPDQPSARLPAASTISSQRSWFKVAPATLNIEAMWLTLPPAFASSCARCTESA